MFESAALGRSYPAKEYAALENDLRMKLFKAQGTCIEHKLPVLITIAGVDGSGRGAVANMLSEWMDAKTIRNHAFWMQTDDERTRPEAWQFWNKLPAGGEIGVFLGGWYGGTIRRFCCGDIGEREFNASMERWRRLEHTLASSGTVIVKLWLHLGKKVQKARLKDRLKHQEIHHFTPYDKKSAENYDGLVSAAAKAITLTDRVDAPWTVIDAYDGNFRNASVARAIIAAVEAAVAVKRQNAVPVVPTKASEEEIGQISALDAIDLSRTCERGVYKKELAELQSELYDLTYKAYKKGISSTILFEGWDAAGKGGAIRRLTSHLDPRGYKVNPTAAPNDVEKVHHYLWRFWREMPKAGHIAIFDRTWYGRVMVERIEGFCSEADWKRAYQEINEMEEHMANFGAVIVKFWIHIDKDEQERRFKERMEDPAKQWKITDEDWRNREKWDAYEQAVNEMLVRTSTTYAPWTIIEGNFKYFARVKVLETVVEAMEEKIREVKKLRK